MKKNIKVIVIVSILAIVLSISLAYFSYYRVGTNHEVVAGDVYMELENGNDTMNMTNVFPETIEEARDATKHTGDKNNIISFNVSGKNDTNKDIYYEILLNEGEEKEGKTRFNPEHLVFDLVEIDGENRRMLVDAVSFEDLNEAKIWVDVVKRGTNSSINRQYELRMWLSDKVTFGEGPGIDYTSEVFANSYASVKVSVRADMERKSYPLTYTLEPTLNNFSLYLKNDYVDDDEGQATNDTVRLKVSSDDDNIRFNYSYVIVTPGATEDDEDIETLVPYTDQSSIDETFNYTINEVKNISMKVKNSNLNGSDITFEVIKNGVLVQKFIKRVYKSQTDINIMDVFPSGITDNKATITKVEFKNVSQSTFDSDYEIVENGNVYDLTLNDGELHGDVRGKLDNDILTIVSVGKTYLNTGYILFREFTGVTEFDFTNIDTSLVDNMYGMFYKCTSLTSLDVSNFDTRNVTNMGFMFSNCKGLTSLDLSSFNTSKVTDMQYMFAIEMTSTGYMELVTIVGLENFDTSKVTTMKGMFSRCHKLTSLDLSNFDTSNVTTMHGMFYLCSGLTSLDLSSFNTNKVTSMPYMFCDCSGLETIYVSNLWNTSKVTDSIGMFSGCTKIKGGNGTSYSSNYVGKTRAVIDTPAVNGYLTYKPLTKDIKDKSGNGYHATNIGTTIVTDESNNKAFSFNGTANHILVPTLPASINWRDGFIVEFKAKWNALNSSSRIFDFGNGRENDNIIVNNYDTSDVLRFWTYSVSTGQTVNIISSPAGLQTLHEYRIEYKNSSSEIKVYQDGVLVNTISQSLTVNNVKRTNNYIGKSNWSSQGFFSGLIYYLKISQIDGTPILWYDANDTEIS